jgi:hypothetical protein
MPLKRGYLRNKSKKSYNFLKGKLSEGSLGLQLTQMVSEGEQTKKQIFF